MTEDERTASIVAQVLDLREQRDAIRAAQRRQAEAAAEQDRLDREAATRRRRTILKAIGAGATVAGVVVAWVLAYGDSRAEAAAEQTKETRRREDVDTSIRALRVDVNANRKAIDEVGEALDSYVEDQRAIDQAEIQRARRQEIMLERLARDRGVPRPTKTEAHKDVEAKARKAAGLPVDEDEVEP